MRSVIIDTCIKIGAGLAKSKPLHPFGALTPEPGLQLGTLAVSLLTLGGAYVEIDGGGHVNWGTP